MCVLNELLQNVIENILKNLEFQTIYSMFLVCCHFYQNKINTSTFRCSFILLIAIRPSDGDVKPGGPLGAFRDEQAMSRHPVSPSPFLSSSSSSHTTQLHYTNSYTYSHPNLNFLQYTIQILVPHIMWSAQAVRELKIDHTQRHV